MGCAHTTEEEPVEARRARAVGMTLADNMAPTSEELNELARREAMTPMKINCQTNEAKVMPRVIPHHFMQTSLATSRYSEQPSRGGLFIGVQRYRVIRVK